ncbi:MAG: carboxymuconolactone decarboxylase family protein [Acidimicrobiales bacterium]|nr:carboxymuconolactone decarboxylase family protein [Acidimicrobiales bacterium]
MRFPTHTPDSADGKAAELLADIVSRNGSARAMVRTMAGSPSVLGGYLDLSRAMKRSRLERGIAERISLAVQARLGCALCLEAHANGARAAGVDEQEIERAKLGTSADPRVAAIVAFGARVHQEPSSIGDDDIRLLRDLGFRDRDVLDVVGLVALNVLTGTFNLVAGLEPDHLAASA